ncbi:hypothetical protein [Komagataeibacter xylinus]|uniref:hypothetical protein n=1 Tax=Komagataeibacter xylinus TaxID=28448 RepID=UPI0013EEDC08|nr:hypothetical protein [Komagataeibacter xylinus]
MADLLKFGERSGESRANPEPRPALPARCRDWMGSTCRPHAAHGEGTVQTTNAMTMAAAKAEVV